MTLEQRRALALAAARLRARESARDDIDVAAAAGPAAEMTTGERFSAAYGSALPNLARGVKQQVLDPAATFLERRFGTLGTSLGFPTAAESARGTQASVDEARRLEAPLMQTGGGLLGNIAGNAALFAPSAFIPGVNTYTGSAALGAGIGALAPTATGESQLINVGAGLLGGAAGQGIGRGIGRAIRPIQPALTAQQQAGVRAAEAHRIPLSLGQRMGSAPLRTMESVFERLPFTSRPALEARTVQQQAFNRAVLGTAGITDDVATAANMGARKATLGKTFEEVAGRNAVDFNAGVIDRLVDIVGKASRRLTPDKAANVANTVDDLIVQVDKYGKLPGTLYQAWRGDLRALSKGTDYESSIFRQIRKTLDDAFNAQISGTDAAAWRQASGEYASLKTILDAMGGAGAQTKIGNIGPAQLEQAMTRQIGREGKALGRGRLNELVSVGRQFVSDAIPDSGTAQRNFMTGLLTGNIAPGFGGAGIGYVASGGDPSAAVAGGLLGAGAALTVPRAVQAIVSKQLVQKYLSHGLIALSSAERKLIADMARTGGIGAAQALSQ